PLPEPARVLRLHGGLGCRAGLPHLPSSGVLQGRKASQEWADLPQRRRHLPPVPGELMIKVGLDTETRLIQPGLLAPPMVCVSYAPEEIIPSGVSLWSDDLGFLREWLAEHTLVL